MTWTRAAASEGALTERDLISMFLGLPEAVFVLDSVGAVRWANHAAERMFGWSIAEWIGRSAIELVHPDDVELAVLSLDSVQQKAVGTAIEVRVQTATGWRLVEVIGAPLPEVGDAIVMCLRDLTERRRWEVAADEEAKFRSLMQNAAAVTMLVSSDGTVAATSAALTRLLGHDPELVAGAPLANIVDEADHEALSAALADATDRGTRRDEVPLVVEVRLRNRRDGTTVPFALTIVNLLEDPTVEGLVISAHDLSDRAAIESELRNTLSLLNATLDSTADGILVVDNSGRITSFNRSFTEMWRVPESILDTRDDAVALQSVLDQVAEPEAFLEKVKELYADLEAESSDTVEFKDGRVFERTSKPQRVDCHIVGRVWSFSDVTDRKRLEAELAHQAFHDSLTGLANKALFRDRVEHALARRQRTGGRVGVLFVDLDNFKTVNDSLGHNRGDQLLAAVADRIRKCLRSSDTAARLGGDEFAVLLEDISTTADAEVAADRIITTLTRPFRLAEMDLTISASVGIAFDAPEADVDHVLRNADLAMYQAKAAGRSRHALYEPEMHVAAVERLEIEADLRRASRNGELVVYYQPIIELHSGATIGAEALVRWQHPTRGLLPPTAFIRLAEETGHIDDIGRFVMNEACNALREWQEAATTPGLLSVTVNLSAHELVRPWIVRDVSEAIENSGVAPEDLVIEITESALMADGPIVVGNLHGLKNLGVRLAIDDFGTGYSSLSYLRRFPIDILKIDGSFIRAIEDGPEAAALARAIVKLAHNLELVAVAEHVETRVQADFLRNLSCHHAQGYYFGAPQAKTAFSQLVTA